MPFEAGVQWCKQRVVAWITSSNQGVQLGIEPAATGNISDKTVRFRFGESVIAGPHVGSSSVSVRVAIVGRCDTKIHEYIDRHSDNVRLTLNTPGLLEIHEENYKIRREKS